MLMKKDDYASQLIEDGSGGPWVHQVNFFYLFAVSRKETHLDTKQWPRQLPKQQRQKPKTIDWAFLRPWKQNNPERLPP